MELWIPLTIGAAFFQNIRSALQKHLSGKLSTLGAAYVRFLYALPIALIYLIGLAAYTDKPLPDISSQFLLYAVLGGICQIIFTVFLLWLFSFRNFAVGTTLSKLETIMVAIFGLLLLGDTLTSAVVIAISVSALGLIVLSVGQSKLSVANALTGLGQKSTLIGLGCAAWLGLSVVLFRAAALSLQHDQFLIAAAYTLFIVLVIQTLVMGISLALRDFEEFRKVFIYWRPACLVGISGGVASIGWFSAFTLQNASYVRALGQIELVFTFIVTLFWFREKVGRAEVLGIALIMGSIIILLLGG
ncbi:MAG: DMT family transporter [Gammaproteobacteria bacterium]|nr:MAG: DMT family transporter [Gammaproteobacteria bacterium]